MMHEVKHVLNIFLNIDKCEEGSHYIQINTVMYVIALVVSHGEGARTYTRTHTLTHARTQRERENQRFERA